MLFLHLLSILGMAAPPDLPMLPSGETYDPTRSFAPLVEAVQPAVVTIEVTAEPASDSLQRLLGFDPEVEPGPSGEGSGFIIDPAGYMLTNAHVIEDAKSYEIVLQDGERVQADIVGRDTAMDIALLKLKGTRQWPTVQLGDSDAVRVGDWVVALGNALGLGSTATFGIVSGKGRVIGHDVFGNEDFIQTDAAINQGNSGGPLFDLSGRVVGMNTAIIANANTVGFAIPSNLVSSVLPDLRKLGRVARGFLGVRPQTLNRDLRMNNGIRAKEGVLVTRVFPDTPASDGGLRLGDVILAVDGDGVTDEEALISAIANRRPGDKVALRIERKGKTKTVTVVLAERRDEEEEASSEEDEAPTSPPEREDLGPDIEILRVAGVLFGPIPPVLADQTGIKKGVLVARARRGAGAEAPQLGDIVVEANRRRVDDVSDLAKALDKKSGDAKLVVIRDGKRVDVTLARE
ncbi:MAG: trypsin-like peptidase domain-containing protein [Myxococcota bacterium]